MASGTVYGNQVGHWRCYGDWWTSENETAVIIYCRPGMQSLSWGFNLSGIEARANIGGSTADAVGDFYSGRGASVSTPYLTHQVTYSKSKNAYDVDVYAKITNATGYESGTSTAYAKVPVAALASYTVSYDANGGSGAPSAQTKWYGETLYLSSTKPSRTGYSFQGWGINNSTSTVTYGAGSAYSANTAITLYAIWKADTYTISYNANGGSGAPSAQTKTYGINLTLSSTRPSRSNYNFVGWATTASATSVSYSPGGTYSTNAPITLYAVWSLAYLVPRINSVSISRCNSDGSDNDAGTYAKVFASWVTDKPIKSISIAVNGTTYSVDTGNATTSGSFTEIVGNNSLNSETNYVLTITVIDQIGSNSYTSRVPATNYILDFTPDGSVCIGGPAKDGYIFPDNANYNGKQLFSVNAMTQFNKAINGVVDVVYKDTWNWFMLARGYRNTSNYNEKGWVHILGEMGPWGGMMPVDVLVNLRNSNSSDDAAENPYQVVSNCDVMKGSNSVRIIVTRDSSNRICVWIAITKWASYNFILSGNQMEVVVSDYTVPSSGTPDGHTVIFNSGISNTFGTKCTVMATLSKESSGVKNDYWGFKSVNESNDYIRTTANGLIPVLGGNDTDGYPGQSNLGTDLWPFYSVVTHRVCMDYISANTKTNTDKKIKFWWGDGTTDPCGFGGGVCRQLWSGTLSAGGSITISELYKYNIFIVYLNGVTAPLFCFRQYTDQNVVDIAGGGVSPYSETYSQMNVANNIGTVLLRATAYNAVTLRAAYVVQQNPSANWMEARAVIRIIGVI